MVRGVMPAGSAPSCPRESKAQAVAEAGIAGPRAPPAQAGALALARWYIRAQLRATVTEKEPTLIHHRMLRPAWVALGLIFLTGLLSACGGGGDATQLLRQTFQGSHSIKSGK